MQFQYGAPSQPLAERPRCWSKSFDDSSRECRNCSFQTSCKEEIIRMNAARQAAPQAPTPYYQPQPFQPYAVPQPVSVVYPSPQPQQVGVPQFKGLSPVPAPQPVQVAPPINTRPVTSVYPLPPQQYGYGWIQDPLYYTLASAPPPMRPQMGDESFFDRTVKNVGLAMLESFFGQCLIAVRQMVLPPTPPKQPAALEAHPNGQVYEVPPRQ